MKKKQLQRLKKQLKNSKKSPRQVKPTSYIGQITHYAELFSYFPQIKYLTNNVIEADRLLKQGLLPQPLPKLLLPDNIQDVIFQFLNDRYPQGDHQGDVLWEKYSAALPKLDKLLRDFRDYLENTYGMWSYTNFAFINALSQYLDGQPVLEIMAGNGYISKGLRDKNPFQTIYTTDSKAWVKENETGKHPVTEVETLTAVAAIQKYGQQVKFVIMSWAPDKDENYYQILKLLREQFPNVRFLVIGERNGATNSKRFWQLAQLSQPAELKAINQALTNFDLIDEQVYLVE